MDQHRIAEQKEPAQRRNEPRRRFGVDVAAAADLAGKAAKLLRKPNQGQRKKEKCSSRQRTFGDSMLGDNHRYRIADRN
jgi:hypothetical protein